MKNYFIYMFLSPVEEPLYIGSSVNLIQRVQGQHFLSPYGNLSEECILKTKTILYHKCVSEDDMKIKERYLINTLNPQYNEYLNNQSRFSFSIDIDWNYLSVDRENLIKKRKENIKKKSPQKIYSLRMYELDYEKYQKYMHFKCFIENKGWENNNLGTAISDGIKIMKDKFDLTLVEKRTKAKRARKREVLEKIRVTSAQITIENFQLLNKLIDYKIDIEAKENYNSVDIFRDLITEIEEQNQEFSVYLKCR